jgi:drug/metabolite transporter (DMT)-like permease
LASSEARGRGTLEPVIEDRAGRRERRVTEFGLVLMVTFWGLNFAVAKWAFGVFEPFAFNALRHLLASAFMLPVLLARGGIGRPDSRDLPRVIALGVVGIIFYQLAFVTGLDRTRAGNASLILALVPIFLLILGGRSPGRPGAAWAGAAMSVVGVALVSGGALRLEGPSTLVGDALLVFAAFVWAIYTRGSQHLVERYGPIRTTAWTLWVGTLGLVLVGTPALVRQPWREIPAEAWGSVAYSGLLAIGVCYLLWYRGVQRLGGPRTAVFSNLTPIVALAAGAIWLGERWTLHSVAGAAMVIGGILLVRFASR